MADEANLSVSVSVIIFIATVLWLLWGYIAKPIVRNKLKVLQVHLVNKFTIIIKGTMTKRKQNLFRPLHDHCKKLGHPLRVVDVGSGSGPNLEFLPDGTEIIGLDPNDLWKNAMIENVEKTGRGIKLGGYHVGKAENMSMIETESVDACIGTFILCSVKDADKSLAEILRILKPGGKYIFMEHIQAEDQSWIKIFQILLYLPWKWMSHCRLIQQTPVIIQKAGFSKVDLEMYRATEMLKMSHIINSFILNLVMTQTAGCATK